MRMAIRNARSHRLRTRPIQDIRSQLCSRKQRGSRRTSAPRKSRDEVETSAAAPLTPGPSPARGEGRTSIQPIALLQLPRQVIGREEAEVFVGQRIEFELQA